MGFNEDYVPGKYKVSDKYLYLRGRLYWQKLTLGVGREWVLKEFDAKDLSVVDFGRMSKKELDDYALNIFGVELDRRRNKKDMINKLLELTKVEREVDS
jgi:hypothetical protein